MSNEWRSNIVPAYKNKGNAQNCSNYGKVNDSWVILWYYGKECRDMNEDM